MTNAVFSPTAPTLAWETLDASDAGDTEIRPGCCVRILASPDTCPLFMRVDKVLCNDELCVSDLYFPAARQRVKVCDVALGLTREAVAVGNGVA